MGTDIQTKREREREKEKLTGSFVVVGFLGLDGLDLVVVGVGLVVVSGELFAPFIFQLTN